MATHERERTAPARLCLDDGRHLDPDARGWSRRPMLEANLRGGWGRTKRWDYWGILAGDLVVSVTYADVDYLGIADVWWADLATGRTGGRSANPPLARGLALPDTPGSAPLLYRGRRLSLDLADDAAGTHLTAAWVEGDGTPARLDATVARPAGHESLDVVIPWSDRTFQYTSKHQARPARGRLLLGDDERWFGDIAHEGDAGEAWGVLDVGRGRWPYRTNWNWGGGAGRSVDGDHVVGIQIGGRWTEGTGFTENGVLVDGRLTKIGDELAWDYRWDDPMRPWHVRAPGGELDLTLAPRHDKHTRIEVGVMGMEVHQVFGRWTGTVRTDDGLEVAVDGIDGFAEESRSRW
jgi:hypothetical protein